MAASGLTTDRWLALARSSPWLWRTAHFMLRRDDDPDGPVEVWLDRRKRMRTKSRGDVRSQKYERRASTWFGWDERGETSTGTVVQPEAWEVRVDRDPDGLVAERPGDYREAEELMWRDYRFVAMLDPVELAEPSRYRTGPAATIERCWVDERDGRLTWWAELTDADGYDPRCTCCALLDGAVAARLVNDEGGPAVALSGPRPTRWRVGLDRGSGIVVSLQPLDGDSVAGGFEVELLGVDSPID